MHAAGSFDITLVNILNKATKLTEDEVSRKITAAVEKEYPETASFKGKYLIMFQACLLLYEYKEQNTIRPT